MKLSFARLRNGVEETVVLCLNRKRKYSHIAEAIFLENTLPQVVSISARIGPAEEISPIAIQVMKELGIGLSKFSL
jgi:hypothetical protein